VNVLEILAHPLDEVIFIDTLYDLMQQIGRDEFVYICPWKI